MQAIETVLFDFGGTLDSDGVAWKERFFALYRSEGLDLSAEAFAPAFYAADDALVGALFSGDDITNIFGNGFNLYYNPDAPENAYLNRLTYQLAGGGELIALVPEPGTLMLLLSGLGVVLILRRRSDRTIAV